MEVSKSMQQYFCKSKVRWLYSKKLTTYIAYFLTLIIEICEIVLFIVDSQKYYKSMCNFHFVEYGDILISLHK